ncbi:CehA/McbA family metallohydrolase [Wukongibacter baidiensis]|uniref:CehA/McbA family metallohydrolase n=1 Tax=Wukongibacter baidiensis TaxID=1723361 RepID=UPI003D7F37AE
MYVNPYENFNKEGKWLKGNFHTHTSFDGCGTKDIEDVISAYKDAEYDVLSITGHDKYIDGKAYEEKYGIRLINGYEYSSGEHMCCIGVKELVKADTHQKVIDGCLDQGAIVVMNHPNWDARQFGFNYIHWDWNELEKLQRYTGLEICNLGLERWGGGNGLATDTWDNLLSKGRVIWGFANDDMHYWEDFANAWNMIYSEGDDEDSILSAIRAGAVYASTGIYLDEFDFDNDSKILRISANLNKSHVNENEYKFIGENGSILHEIIGPSAEYQLSGEELYVRVEVRSRCGAMLFTQPIYRKINIK